MSFLDSGTGTLEDALRGQAETANLNIENLYARKRRQSVAQAAHGGRLGSGVYNYEAGDINTGETGALGQVQNALAYELGQVPLQDYASQQDAQRQAELARLLAEIQKASPLQEALGALGVAGNVAGIGAGIAALL